MVYKYSYVHIYVHVCTYIYCIGIMRNFMKNSVIKISDRGFWNLYNIFLFFAFKALSSRDYIIFYYRRLIYIYITHSFQNFIFKNVKD